MAWNVQPSQEELQTLMEAGFLLRDARRFEDARIVFQGVKALAPGAPEVDVALGVVAFHEGDFPAAKKHYEQAVALNPRDAWAYAHLGEVELFSKRKNEAIRFLKKAVELDEKGPYGKMARRLLQLADEIRFDDTSEALK
jgi:tetratricopeptide (TPR) repeat protein